MLKSFLKQLMLRHKNEIVDAIEGAMDHLFEASKADAEMVFWAIFTRIFGKKK